MDDWKPGDLALCIKVGRWSGLTRSGKSFAVDAGAPLSGRFYTVKTVLPGVAGLVLRFSDFPDYPHPMWTGYSASRFRKVTPPEADAFDREVIEQMTAQPATAEGVGA